MKVNQNNIFKFSFFSLVVVVILLLTFRGDTDGDKLYLQSLEVKIERYQKQVLQLSSAINRTKRYIGRYEDSVAIKEKEILRLKKSKKYIIQYYEKQLSDIDSYTMSDVDSALRARYPSPHLEGEIDPKGPR